MRTQTSDAELLVTSKQVKPPIIHIAVVEDNPLRLMGFRSILDPVPDFRLTAMSVSAIQADIAILGNHAGVKFFETMANLRALHPGLRVLVTGSGMDDQSILQALMSGAKGYVDEAAPSSQLVQAIYGVAGGSIWAPRHVISMLVESSSDLIRRNFRPVDVSLTCREKQVLTMLVEGCSNKEIGNPLGIEERTVKAHVSKMMRKMGVRNRIALSVHAVRCSLVPVQ
jgi:DNA-binding NarL/FixJ family response regulator